MAKTADRSKKGAELRQQAKELLRVSLRQVKDGIRLTVRDNGTGLCRKSAKGTGHGFVSMSARALKLGGTLSVQSKPEKGTRVVLDLPRKQSAKYVTF